MLMASPKVETMVMKTVNMVEGLWVDSMWGVGKTADKRKNEWLPGFFLEHLDGHRGFAH